MSKDTLIKVEGVSKKFCRNLKKSLWYGMKDLGDEIRGKRHGGNGELRPDEFWAVNDVSFELKRGECIGLIGGNGAGKSTLLKMLNGLIKPDQGRIQVHGRIGALIELNAGFNPILTGRENIYINGQILGLTKREIDRKLDEIVAFAEIDEFLDMPVQNYSSGMKVRLGFAVAAQMEPDVLIIDEVLAVGDVGFRSRCFNFIDNLQKNAALVFVSHQMPQVARLSTRILLLSKGTVLYQGSDVPLGIEKYYSTFAGEVGIVSGSGRAEIRSHRLSSNGRSEVPSERFVVNYMEDLTITLEISAERGISALNINIAFFDKELRGIAQSYSVNSDFRLYNDRESITVQARIPQLNFNPGVYTMSLIITDESRGETLINYHAIKDFQVAGSFIGFTPVQFRGDWSRID